jgi:hypothetical protein
LGELLAVAGLRVLGVVLDALPRAVAVAVYGGLELQV